VALAECFFDALAALELNIVKGFQNVQENMLKKKSKDELEEVVQVLKLEVQRIAKN
jgi:hypothetical protein